MVVLKITPWHWTTIVTTRGNMKESSTVIMACTSHRCPISWDFTLGAGINPDKSWTVRKISRRKPGRLRKQHRHRPWKPGRRVTCTLPPDARWSALRDTDQTDRRNKPPWRAYVSCSRATNLTSRQIATISTRWWRKRIASPTSGHS